jgi:hypothetical protein
VRADLLDDLGGALTERDLFLANDLAIAAAGQDGFQRERLVERIVAEARTASPDGGFVIGLCGPWGIGKTSVANLAIARMERDSMLVVRFNPWMFSGAEDLVGRFFGELATILGRRDRKLKEVARRVAGYASALSTPANLLPFVGPGVALALSTGGQLAGLGSSATLNEEYNELAAALARLRRRIVVFLDDLDRLADDDIREIVRLVKAVGNLPNLTYILAFDREHVEFVLGGAGEPRQSRERGRRYLEKIVQVRHDVPPPGDQELLDFYVGQLREVLERHGVEDRLPVKPDDVLRAVGQMLHTPRDAKRAANSFAAGLDLHGEEVATVDLIGLEALRTFEPDLHESLPRLADILLDYSPGFFDVPERVADERKSRMGRLIEHARNPDATRALLQQLFPAARRTLGDGRGVAQTAVESRLNRVAVSRVFRRYAHAVLTPAEVRSRELEHLAGLAASDAAAFEQALGKFRDDRLIDLLERLPAALPRLDVAQARASAAALLRATAGSENGSEAKRWHETTQDYRVSELVTHLLENEPDLDRRRELVRDLFDGAPDLTTRWRLIDWFGTHPWYERRARRDEWLGEKISADLARTLSAEVREADADALADEVEMGILLETTRHSDPEAARNAFAAKASSEHFVLTLLRYLAGAVRSSDGVYRFDWRTYIRLLGEDVARDRALDLAVTTDMNSLDDMTRSGLADAAAIARGDMQPARDSFEDDDEEETLSA